ncbi:hypothetical protein BH09GEM1_BH09GEM1_37750 [soil metagenome]
MAPLPGLVTGRLDVGDTTVRWAVAPGAPVSTHEQPEGCALLLGDAIQRRAAARLSAASLFDAWTDGSTCPDACDGFYAGVAVRSGAITIGGDILGLFPLYYAAFGDVLLAGSSSAPFKAHPLFDDTLDVHAMFGHLLSSGPFDGRTLRRGVSRLSVGRLLRWSGRGPVREETQYEMPVVHQFTGASFEDELERFDVALDAAVRRHCGVHPDITVMLSGGRDSRLLSGYLARQGRSARTVAFGRASDSDAQCAAAVARALHFPHRCHEVPFDAFPDYTDRNVHWEQLAGGMSSVHSWGCADALRNATGGLLSGYTFDARHQPLVPITREGMLGWTHGKGIAPARLRALVNEPHRACVDEVAEAVRQRFDEFSVVDRAEEVDGERSWRWFMAVYTRFHAGAIPWRLSFGAWPILPLLDQELIATMLTMPHSFLADRRMEDALLRKRFPALARLPLDRNAPDTSPLVSTLRHRISASWRARMHRDTDVEQRYYVRMYDFDNEGWRAVRWAAETGRDAMAQWFEPAALRSILPAPDASTAHADPITSGFAPKMLTGIMRACATGEMPS